MGFCLEKSPHDVSGQVQRPILLDCHVCSNEIAEVLSMKWCSEEHKSETISFLFFFFLIIGHCIAGCILEHIDYCGSCQEDKAGGSYLPSLVHFST